MTDEDRTRVRAGMARGGEARERQDHGAALVHALAAKKAKSLFADMMAGAGVGYNQIAKEMLFFLPDGFMDAYEQLWHKGLGGKDDGGVGARGAAQAETGRLGKAPTRNVPGKIQISGGGAKRKSYKKYWVIADERALQIKDRVDKRLRALAREIQDELEGLAEEGEEGREGRESEGKGRARCSECGRLMREGWKFCPYDAGKVGHDE